MLLMSLLALMLIGWCAAAPVGREVYRMPQNALQALSDRGTVVMEAAVYRALSAVDRTVVERGRVEAACGGCTPCLFQDCGKRSGKCAPVEREGAEPSCEVIARAHALHGETERSWALSQACASYYHTCAERLTPDACVRSTAQTCSSRVLQCSLSTTLHSLDTALDSRTPAVCGHRASLVRNLTQPRWRIMGGSPAPPGSWPWLVSLQLNGALMCGGVLVDSSWVLTAAHCFTGSRSESYWTVVVGEFDITKSDPDEQVMRVNRIITHPKFDPKSFNNDIALVELSSPVVLSERVTPVCLPEDVDPSAGTACLVAGWGSMYEDGPPADVVMEAQVPLLPQRTCRSALGEDLFTNTMFCAGYLSGGIDSCQGDSGGPLIFQDHVSGRFQLYGITSWGDGCGEKNKPGVYTRVTAFRDWILTEIHKSSGSREPTCPELLKTSELSEERRGSEVVSLCHVYTLGCPPTFDPAACQRLAQDKCRGRLKKCELRSFLQTLLDLLHRADDYLRDNLDLTFFTESLPQLVEHVYSSAVNTRTRRHTLEAEQVSPPSTASEASGWKLPSIFEQVGPLVDDWENYLSSMAEGLGQRNTSAEMEEHLFQQDEEASVHLLDRDLRSVISLLRSRQARRHVPVLPEWNGHILQADFVPMDGPFLVRDWNTLLLRALTEGDTGREAGSLPITALPGRGLSFETLPPRPVKLSEYQEFRTQQHSPEDGIQTWTSDWLLESELIVTSPTPTQLPMPDQLSTSRKENEVPKRRRRRHLPHRPKRSAGSRVCPGLAESAQLVTVTKETYSWILDIAPSNLSMNFQEVLVDLTTKNERGLYEARFKAIVGGRPLTFYSHVGLESAAFYRSLPRILSRALDALKT